MADISKVKLPDGSVYDIKDAKALPKTTYEYNKEISFGSSGKLLIGKFKCYDSNVTIEINSTTSTTYHAVAILATQNINTSHGGSMTWNVYGDDSNTVASNLYLYYPSNSQWIEIYFSPSTWSKNLIHIQCIGIQAEATNVCENVSAIPETATVKPTNISRDAYVLKAGDTMGGHLKWNASSLPESTNPEFMLTIDSFTNGGTQRWATKTTVIDKWTKNNTTAGHLGWTSNTADKIPITSNTLAYWNGRYNATTSNLTYCSKGAFGTAAVADLSTATNSTSTTTAATPSAVKTAYDLANTANTTANTALSGVNGNLIYDQTFTISNGVATFTPHVYQKGAEVTTNYAKSCFTWKYRLIDGSEVSLTTNSNRGCTVTISGMGYGGHVIGIFTPA